MKPVHERDDCLSPRFIAEWLEEASATLQTIAGNGAAAKAVFCEAWGRFTDSPAFRRVLADTAAGFIHLVDDLGQSRDIIQEALQAGDFGGAMKVGLAGMMLEWTRFRNRLTDLWEELKPTWNSAVENAASAVGGVITDLKISWGDVWDSLLRGLNTFLAALEGTFNAVCEAGPTCKR